MKKILLLISLMTIISPELLMADNMLPPAGPYKSIRSDMSSFSPDRKNTNDVEILQRENIAVDEQIAIPEWVRQRQAEMDNWLKQQSVQASRQLVEQPLYQSHPVQPGNHQAMQWNQGQTFPVNGPVPQLPPQAVNPMFSQPQTNRMKQYFPASRGPVYGPNIPPPAIYNNQNYQNSQPVAPYPPMWR